MLPFEQKTQSIVIKKEAKTDLKFGKKPEERTAEELLEYGIVNINKPAGPTSHQTASYVKDILHINKAGHGGTLDPQVTGCLPVALNKATRITQALLSAGKQYITIMHVHKPIEESILKDKLNKYTGEITQLPPIKSAVKRQKRKRKIYDIEILEIHKQDVLLKIDCQGGTYIRKYIHDAGKLLGCGAHMAKLIRTKAGPFNTASMVSLQDLADAYHYYKEEHKPDVLQQYLQPIEAAVLHLPKVWVLDTTINSLCHGAVLNIPGIAKLHDNIKNSQLVAVMSLKDELVCLGIATMTSEEIMQKEKGTAVKTKKVFMAPDVYPRLKSKV